MATGECAGRAKASSEVLVHQRNDLCRIEPRSRNGEEVRGGAASLALQVLVRFLVCALWPFMQATAFNCANDLERGGDGLASREVMRSEVLLHHGC